MYSNADWFNSSKIMGISSSINDYEKLTLRDFEFFIIVLVKWIIDGLIPFSFLHATFGIAAVNFVDRCPKNTKPGRPTFLLDLLF